MPNFNTSMYSAQNGAAGASLGSGIPSSRDAGGKLRIISVPYTVDGAETAADTITICKLPKGAKLLPSLCRIQSNAGFDCNDVDIGISGNVNKYADALDTLDTVSDISFGTAGDVGFAPSAVTDDAGETIIATLVAVVTTTAGGLVHFQIAYLYD